MTEQAGNVGGISVKLGIEPDAGSFAAADKALEGVAAIASQLVQAVSLISARLDAMALAAVEAGAALQTALAPKVPAAGGSKPFIRAFDEGPHNTQMGPALPPGFKPEEVVEKAKRGLFDLVSIGKVFAAQIAGSFVVEHVKAFTEEIVHLAGPLEGISQRLGITTDDVQELGYAAKLSNADVAELEQGLKFLGQNAAQAAAGSKTDASAFKALGISVKDASGHVKGTPELLGEAADAISRLPTAAQQSAAAMALFGRSGVQLLPMLKRGSAGIAELREEARKLGGGLSEDVIKQADEFESQMKRVDFALLSVKSTIASVLLPVLEALSQALIDVISWTKDVAKNTYFFQAAIGVGLYAALTKVIPLVRALTVAQLQAARTALVAAVPYLLWAAAAIAFVGAIDELYNLLKGNKSVLGQWLDEWKGIGTTDQLVKSWSAGIEVLGETIHTVGDYMSAMLTAMTGIFQLFQKPLSVDSWKNAGKAVMGAGKAVANVATGAVDAVTSGVQAYGLALDGGPEGVNRATGRGMDAGAIADDSTPRAVARGIAAGRLKGSAGFGQAARGSSILNGGGANVQQTNVLNVTTGANPEQVRKVVQEEHGKANRRLRAALAPKAAQ
jgi:hypothetical protein